MNNVAVYLERRNYIDTNNYNVRRSKLQVISGDVNIAGSRAVDNAEFIIKSPYDVKTGDTVSFISDDISVNKLSGAWNFYNNVRDESGYNLDASPNNIVYNRVTDTTSRFLGHTYADCSTTPYIEIEPTVNEGNNTLHNFDNDTEIVIWCKPSSMSNGDKQVIFSRSNGTTGLEIGITKNNNKYYAYCQVKGSSDFDWGNASDDINSNSEVDISQDLMIKCRRSESFNKGYKISVNNNSNTTYATYTGDIEGGLTHKIRFASDFNSSQSNLNNAFNGRLYSIRIYNEELDDIGRSILYSRRQPYTTMKFAGLVSKVDKGNTNTLIQVSGFSSELLLKTELTQNISSQLTGMTGVNNFGAYKNTLLETIIKDIISVINTNVLNTNDIKYEFVFNNQGDDDDDVNSTDVWKHPTNKLHARNIDTLLVSGKLLTMANILAILGGNEVDSNDNLIHNNGANSFFMLPRKVLIFESTGIKNHTHFRIGKYNIIDGGYNDNSLYNDVSVYGKHVIKHKSRTFNSIILNFEYELVEDKSSNQYKKFKDLVLVYKDAPPDQILIPITKYKLNGDKIIFNNITLNSGESIVVMFEYIDLSNNSDAPVSGSTPTNDRSYYYQQQNDASIQKNGKRSKKLYFPILEDTTTMAAICRRFLGSHLTKSRKIKIIAPYLTNSIFIGTNATVSNIPKKIYSEELTVKSINYKFPNFRTTVEVGDYNYNLIDNIGEMLDIINSMESVRTGA